MRIKKFLTALFLGMILILSTNHFSQAQTGNQSDITSPQTPTVLFPKRKGSFEINPINNPISAVQWSEQKSAIEFQSYFDISFYGDVPSAKQISTRLAKLNEETGKKTAVIYVIQGENELYLVAIFPSNNFESRSSNIKLLASIKEDKIISLTEDNAPIIGKKIPISSVEFKKDIETIQRNLSDTFLLEKENYLPSAVRVYNLIVEPLKLDLENNQIDTLVFILDKGLRSLPMSVLYNQQDQKYLIEEYGVAIIPSFGLTDTSYERADLTSILAMGASKFANQNDLPSVPTELNNIVSEPRKGKIFLNQEFTIDNFVEQNQEEKFDVIHLGTHAQFNPGNLEQSYIYFANNQLSLKQIKELATKLHWDIPENVPVELLVLSACQTALGNQDAELGFAGFAIATGVKSVIASLWLVSDLGTLALMSQFYHNYTTIPVKSEAFRQAQLSLLRKEVVIQDDHIILSDGSVVDIPKEFQGVNLSDFSHPFFWSAFTIIGNWN